ncbi:MAG: glycosyltransferase family 87 protein [Desulfobacterales bacterium]|jgi:hypothetical protein
MSVLDRIYSNPLTAIAFGILAVFLVAKVAFQLPDRALKDDFAHYYIAGQIFLEGKNPYARNLAPLYQQYGFTYDGETGSVVAPNPPTFFFLFAPIALLKPGPAFIAWLAFEIIGLAFSLWLTRRLLQNGLTTRGWLFLCAAIVGSQWVYGQFFHSQVGFLLVALVLAAFALHQQEKYLPAAGLVALAGLIKLFPFILLPWFVLREKSGYKIRAGRMLFTAGFILGLIFLTGIKNWLDYYHFSFRYLIDGSFGIGYNYSLPSFVVNFVYAIYDFRPPSNIAEIWSTIGVAGGLIFLTFSYILCLLAFDDRESEFCFLILAMLVSGTRTLGHYFVFLIFPIALAFARTSKFESKRPFLLMVLIFLALNLHDLRAIQFIFLNRYIFLIFNYIPFYGLLALMIYYLKLNSVVSYTSPDNGNCVRKWHRE